MSAERYMRDRHQVRRIRRRFVRRGPHVQIGADLTITYRDDVPTRAGHAAGHGEDGAPRVAGARARDDTT
jgi:hypothetical protein